MIEIRSLQVEKDGHAICNVSELKVEPGEHVAVIGVNGCGKTTMLRVLAGIERNYKGCCDIHVPLTQRTLVHQKPYLFRGTVLANVAYGLRARGQVRKAAQQEALAWLERLGADRLARRGVRDLSGGEIRRVALARALAIRPQLLLVDEPFTDLDADGVGAAVDLLNNLSDMTILIASPAEFPATLTCRKYDLA